MIHHHAPAPRRSAAVVFDPGGVLGEVDDRDLCRKLVSDGAAIEEFLATICTRAWHEEHDRGPSMATATAELAAKRPERAALIRAFDQRVGAR